MKIQLFFVMMFVLAFIQCSKDQNTNTPSNIDLLTSGPWIQESLICDPPCDFMGKGVLIKDILPYLPICETDDLFFFGTNRHVLRDEGGAKCDSNDPQIEDTGIWDFINDSHIKILSSGSHIDTIEITNGKLIYIRQTSGGSETTTFKIF